MAANILNLQAYTVTGLQENEHDYLRIFQHWCGSLKTALSERFQSQIAHTGFD